MLHLRITCAAEVTDAVLDTLRDDPGTVHLTVVRGAALDPPGDLVQADVVREAADGVLVGAMVVGPEFAPLAALAVGLVPRRGDLVRKAGLAVGVGFPLAMIVTAVGTLAGEWTGLIDMSVIGSLKQVDFIYQVGPFSLILALLAGAAGMLSLVSARSAALIGVFISVTTVPAAAFAVVCGWW